jgi:biopolymer transport protein ExbB
LCFANWSLIVLTLLVAGGPVVWLLSLFSVFALAVIVLKVWQLWVQLDLASFNTDKALTLLQERHVNEALLLTKGTKNPRDGAVFDTMETLAIEGLSEAQQREEAFRRGRSRVLLLGSNLRSLEVIATLAPLLGLLGTVLGMIDAFRAMEAAGRQVDPAVLSGGIWQALLTTAVGLAVAIPVSLAHSWLERRVDNESAAIQDAIERVLTLSPSLKALNIKKQGIK